MKNVNKHLIFMLLAAMLFGTILTACGGDPPTPTRRSSNDDDEGDPPPDEDEEPVDAPTDEPDPTDEPEPTPEPTDLPDPTAGFVDFSNDVLGVSLAHPADWVIEFDEAGGEVNLATSQDVLDSSDDEIIGAVMNVLFLDAEIIGFLGGDGVDTTDPVAVLGIFVDLLSESDAEDTAFDMAVTQEPTAVSINGQTGASAFATATDTSGEEATIKLSVIMADGRAAFIFSGVEDSVEADHRPTLDAIENSVTLSTPVGLPTTESVPVPEVSGFLLFGDSVAGAVDASGPSAWGFAGLEGELVDITVMPEGDFDVVVDVVDENGNSILPNGEVDGAFGAEEILGLTIPTTGGYAILVRGFADATGNFQLTLAEAGTAVAPPPTTGEAGGLVAYGETIAGVVEAESGLSAWIFAGQEGDVLDIIVVPDGDYDVVVDVWDGNGNSILPSGEVDSSFGTEEILGVTIPASDDYIIFVSGFGGAAGSFQLTLAEAGTAVAPPPVTGGTGEPIAFGGFASGSVDAANPVASFSFSGNADEVIGMIITPVGEFDAVIDVLDPVGNSVLSRERDVSFGIENVIAALPVEGVYTINVWEFGGLPGSFDLQLGFPLTNVVLAAPDTLDPDDEGEGHSFPFTALNAGEMVGIYAEPSEDLDIAVQVRKGGDLLEGLGFDPERGFDSSIDIEEFVMIAEETGTYTFRVLNSQDEEFGGNVGDYEVALFGSPDVVFELAYGDFADARTGADGDVEYVISGLTGDSMVVTVVLDDDSVDLVIEVLDLDGNILASIDDGFSGEPEELTYTFESEELVIIRVRDFTGGEGDFTMSVEAGG